METQAYTPQIEFTKSDNLNGLLSITIEKDKVMPELEKELKNMQKRASIKGFRPGKAPMGMINKMYSEPLLAEIIQDKAEKSLRTYLVDNKLDILGYPMYSRETPSQLDVTKDSTFVFNFDIGLAPKLELNFSKSDEVTLYKIEVDDKEIDKDIEYMRERQGSMEEVEVAGEKDVIYASLTELDENGQTLEGGVHADGASFVAELIKDESLKTEIIGKKVGDSLQLDIQKLFNDNTTVIKSTLGITDEVLKDLGNQFLLSITGVKARKLAEINEEYFAKLYGEDVPANEEEYRERVKKNLEHYYNQEAQVWVDHQISHLMDHNHQVELPDNFLKRWLVAEKKENYNEANIEEKYAEEKYALVRKLIMDEISLKFEIQATEEEIKMEAAIYAMSMFRQYGLNLSPNDDYIQRFVADKMKEAEFVAQMEDRVIHQKAYGKIRELITLKEEPTTVEAYYEAVSAHNKAHHH